MNYGIAIFPSKEIQDEANSFRKRYDPNYTLIPPHLTLKEPFQTDQETIDELIGELKHIANRMKPFTISIKKVSSFAPVTNTIYLKVEPCQQLSDLVDDMYSGKFPKEMKHPFVPHITIAQDLGEDEYSDVLGSLRMKTFDFQDEIDRYHLLYQLENGSWTVHESFVFGKEHV
ncbi:MAG TPA: YjcG family protein [Bacillota bacterium]